MKKEIPSIPIPPWVFTQIVFSKRLGRPRKPIITPPPNEIYDISGFKSIIIPQINEETDALGNFIEVVKSYCTSIAKGLAYDAIMVYWGISEPAKTLQELGEKNQVTRERMRQIRNIHLNKIRQLLKGKIINNLKCDSIILKGIHDLRDAFIKHHLLLDEHINQILKLQNINLTEDRKSHLLMFFKVFSIEMTSKINITLHYTRRINNIYKLRKYYYDLKRYFLNSIQSISLKELSKKFNIPYSLIRSLIYIIPDIEEIEEDRYQIKNYKISAAKVAERVLQSSNRPMNKEELLSVVNNLRGKEINQIYPLLDKNIKNIGLTGLWTLKDNDINKDYIYYLIRKALIHYGKPSSIEKIYKYTSEIRPDINLSQVTHNVSRHLKIRFLRLDNGEIILKEWKKTYKYILTDRNRKKTPVIRGKFLQILINVLKNKKLSCSEISRAVSKISGYNDRYCSASLYKSKILKIDKSRNPWVFYLKDNYQEMLDDILKGTRDKAINGVINLFKKENKKELLRSYIIKYMTNIEKVSIPQMYRLLRDKNAFYVKVVSKRCSLVSLNPGYNRG